MKCRECGEEYWPNKPWQLFCSQAHKQRWHLRKKQELRDLERAVPRKSNGELRKIVGERFADAERHKPKKRRNGHRGTTAEREAAKQAFADFTQSLRRPDVEVAQPEPAVLKRRF